MNKNRVPAETMLENPVGKPTLRLIEHPLLRKYFPLVVEDLTTTYTRDLHKWLLLAPVVGITTGLAVTGIAVVILKELWPPVLHLFLRRPWTILPLMTAAFAVTGLVMQFLTPDPDEHSTEEIIRSYHEHQGDIDVRSFLPKILAAITTVGFGGSAALEGPSIYGGGAIGSWLWAKLRRFGLEPRDRRIMLISGAAAGMAAVFRAPMTGLVFALEMPYKDDLAHEALLPSLIASVVSYVTLAFFLGAAPLFNFASANSFTGRDLLWSALLGVLIGLIAMAFTITFRRARVFMVHWPIPHWLKLTLGGFLTGLCGIAFLGIYHGSLVPLGPNYEAVGQILGHQHSSLELVVFGVLKLAATLFTLASGGVSAMFVPLFLTGGSFGTAFAQTIVHSSSVELYAAVGMAAFIAAGYKTPLAAVVFVAEATGGHAFIIPALIGAAVAYAISGEASASGDQRLHESVRVQELRNISVAEVMQQNVVSAVASSNLREFADNVCRHHRHIAFPVLKDGAIAGIMSVSSLGLIPSREWTTKTVEDVAQKNIKTVPPDCDVTEALRLLLSEQDYHMLLVTSEDGRLTGILTKTDILSALKLRDGAAKEPVYEPAIP
ncbi:MAG TPA: chloride channel protein [Acidobacteriaceae bacterium]|nr:chloride channel protein [Acidobacteriaceae bacterium]